MTEDDTVLVCPGCDSTQLRRRSRTHSSPLDSADKRWLCRDCDNKFDDPVRRDRQFKSSNRRGLAGRLAEIGEAGGDER